MRENTKAGAVIAAGGFSRRMGEVDKVFVPLCGKPLLARTIEVFQKSALIDRIVVVLSQQNLEAGQKMIKEQGLSKVVDVCPGGERRQDSVAAGLGRIEDCQWVLIHDGARPLVTEDLIEQGLAAAEETGAAIAAVPVTDTIKMAGDDMFIQGTPPRNSLWVAQTPQVFRFDIVTEAYKNTRYEVTDDARLVEQLGHRVKLYMGSYDNIKVTTPNDLALAEVLWRSRKEQGE